MPTNLFADVKTSEKLERAYARDAISAKDYELPCETLIAHLRSLWETLSVTMLPAAQQQPWSLTRAAAFCPVDMKR